MKIICENCSAKYSIADEKVQGKVFKIRCKKCGESIVVRGDSQQAVEPAVGISSQAQPASEQQPVDEPPPMPDEPGEEEGDAETRVFDYSGYQSSDQDPAIWHIVVDGQQQGPYTGGQIRQFLDTGSLDAESFIWKEGFDDWMPIKNVPELGWAGGTKPRAEIPTDDKAAGGIFDQPSPEGNGLFDQPAAGGIFGQEPAAAADTSSPFDGSAGLFGGGGEAAAGGPADSSGDVFSSAAPAPTGGMFNADTTMEPESAGIFGDAGAGGQDLFGDGAGDGGGLFGGSGGDGGPRVSAAQAMTGQRNENSVLFSLSNLQALAATPAAGDSGGGGGGGMFGGGVSAGAPAAPAAITAPGEEASGLIDIRSLAGTLNTDKDNTGVDDLISMGGGGFAPSLGAPVLAPQNTGLSMPIKIAIIAGSVFALGLIVVLAVMVLKGDDGDADKQLAEAQLEELKKQLAEIRATGGSSRQIESIQTQIARKEQENSNSRAATAANVAKNVAEEQLSPSAAEASKSSKKATSGKRPSASSSRSSSSGSSRSAPAAASSSKRSTGSSASSGSSAPAPKKTKGGADELDDLLGGSLSKPKKSAPVAAKPASGGGGGGGGGSKKSLDRNDVQKGMNSVAARVKACGQGQSGTVTLKVVIGRTGRVMSANAQGAFAGTPVGSCAARAVRSARFPATDANLTVRYPFRL